MAYLVRFLMISVFVCFSLDATAQQSLQLYKLQNLDSRAATAENPFAEKGKGGMTKEGLKGSPALKDFKKGATAVLLDTKGPGMVRHIWCTVKPQEAVDIRNIILRMYWENSDIPSVEVPLSDFFGIAHGAKVPMTSQLISVQPALGTIAIFRCLLKITHE